MNINATLIGQSVAFFIFVFFCMKYIWPPIIAILDERKKKIAEGLEAARKAAIDLENTNHIISKKLKKAKVEASEIINQAQTIANNIIIEAKNQALVEKTRMISNAKAEIQQEINSVKDLLTNQIGKLAILCAEKIIKITINDNINDKLMSKLINDIININYYDRM